MSDGSVAHKIFEVKSILSQLQAEGGLSDVALARAELQRASALLFAARRDLFAYQYGLHEPLFHCPECLKVCDTSDERQIPDHCGVKQQRITWIGAFRMLYGAEAPNKTWSAAERDGTLVVRALGDEFSNACFDTVNRKLYFFCSFCAMRGQPTRYISFPLYSMDRLAVVEVRSEPVSVEWINSVPRRVKCDLDDIDLSALGDWNYEQTLSSVQQRGQSLTDAQESAGGVVK